VPYQHVAAITVIFFVAVTLTACIVTDLGIVFQLIGGIAGSLLIFILPGALIVADHRAAAARSAAPGASGHRGEAGAAAANGRESVERLNSDMRVPILDHGEAVGSSTDGGGSAARGRSRSGGGAHGARAQAGESNGHAALSPKPCYESAWDRLWVGWLLIGLGIGVSVLTVYTSIASYMAPELNDTSLHAGFTTNSTLVDSRGAGRSLRALSVALAARRKGVVS
jgi:hypothetical protein